MSTSGPPSRLCGVPGTRCTGTTTPVEVSLCGQAYASTVGSATGSGREPAGDSTTTGSARNGPPRGGVANLAENPPSPGCGARPRPGPGAAPPQKAVDPPLPSTTS